MTDLSPPVAAGEGVLTVFPNVGEMGTTPFTVEGLSWVDDHLPLTYAVGYRPEGADPGEVTLLSDFTPSSRFLTTVPEGSTGGGGTIDLVLLVRDAKGAVTTATRRLTVTWPAETPTFGHLEATLGAAARLPDLAKGVTAVATAAAVLDRITIPPAEQ
eukprot:389617-Prorocentrum_minimum.AAC.1